jgi:tRNA(Ile)-lysidine synthase
MNDPLTSATFKFLDEHYCPGRGVLLAFSGGPDSLAMLHILLEYRKKHSFFLALAHVNHGWRLESSQEAEMIKQMGKALGLTVHVKVLDPKSIEGNLEAACREERLVFFSSLCRQHDYQAVLLAHHADDRAETVLKRILEGAGLTSLSGLSPLTEIGGIPLWRPLLGISKQKILDWLHGRGLSGFQDSTNLDSRFMRGRFRTKILPYLSDAFGKQINESLWRLGEEVHELKSYLNQQLKFYFDKVQETRAGVFLDLSKNLPTSIFELKCLIRSICESQGCFFSRESVEKAALLLNEGKANKSFEQGGSTLYIDRHRLFLSMQPLPWLPEEELLLDEGRATVFYGSWKISVLPACFDSSRRSDWLKVWQGSCEVVLPKGLYTLRPPKSNASYGAKGKLGDWWTDHKVPAFLRSVAPVVCNQKGVCYEFLSGETNVENQRGEWIKVILENQLAP